MHLVSPLTSGFVAAPSGTATFLRSGTSTPATIYADYNGSDSNTSGLLQLDSYGSGVVYVNQLVDVVVRNAAGSTVATFTAGYSANAVEYIGQSFTGVSPTGGNSVASLPVLLQTILDLWKTQSGSIDFKGLGVDGTAYDIRSWIARLGGLVINVKDPDYGATGDGTTDDTTAIANAIAAAAVAGGTVVIPAGTYRVTSALSVSAAVNIWAPAGPGATIMKMDAASASTFVFYDSTYQQFCTGLRFTNAQSNASAYIVNEDSSANASVSGCYFVGTSTADLVACNGGRFSFEDCVFAPLTTRRAFYSEDGQHRLVRCKFITPATYSSSNGIITAPNTSAGGWVSVEHCDFAVDGTSSGTLYGTHIVRGSVINNLFRAVAGGTWVPIYVPTFVASTNFHEHGNNFEAGIAHPYLLQGVGDSGVGCTLGSRDQRFKVHGTLNTSPALTLRSDSYGTMSLARTNDDAQVITFENAPPGSRFFLRITNSIGGATALTAVTFAANVEHNFDGSLADGISLLMDCVAYIGGGNTIHWLCTCQELNG